MIKYNNKTTAAQLCIEQCSNKAIAKKLSEFGVNRPNFLGKCMLLEINKNKLKK